MSYVGVRVRGGVNTASCRYLCENLHNCSSSFESQILTTHLNEMQVIVRDSGAIGGERVRQRERGGKGGLICDRRTGR